MRGRLFNMYAFSQRLSCMCRILYPHCSHVSDLRCFATKARNVSDLIRWNKENKILYGPVQTDAEKKTSPQKKVDTSKPTRKKKTSDSKSDTQTQTTSKKRSLEASSDATQTRKKKPAESSTETLKPGRKKKSESSENEFEKITPTRKKKLSAKKESVDDATEHRLKEMYLTSMVQSAPGAQAEELQVNNQVSSSPVRKNIQNKMDAGLDQQTCIKESTRSNGDPELFPEFAEESCTSSHQEEVVLDESESLDYFPEEKAGDIHIPKVLPLPGMGIGSNSASSVGRGSGISVQSEVKMALPTPDTENESSEERVPSISVSTKRVRSTPATTKRVSSTAASTKGVPNKPTTTQAPKEMDFVLQCPVLPPEGIEPLSGTQEFRSVMENLGLKLLPTVNMVLNKTRSELSLFFLQRWRQTMINELGEEGFKKHQENVIWEGTNLHACVQQYLSGMPLKEIQVQENNQGHWASLASVLPDVTDVMALETPISHPLLFYRGTFDCVAKYKDVLYVIDWKTSGKPKPLLSNLYDNPVQVAAYLGAINLSAEFTSKFGVIDHAAIVVAYQNGQPAHVHRMKPALCKHYWTLWCQRLHQYWAMTAAEKGLL